MFASRFAAALIVGLSLSATPVTAQQVSEEDHREIVALSDQLHAVVASGDLTAAMDVVPPRLFRHLATAAGMEEAQFLALLRQATAQAGVGVEIVEFELDLNASPQLTPDGRRTFYLFPTTMVMRANGRTIQSTTHTLALEDEGRWGFIRLENEGQIAIVRQIWPEFVDVDLPPASMSVIQP